MEIRRYILCVTKTLRTVWHETLLTVWYETLLAVWHETLRTGGVVQVEKGVRERRKDEIGSKGHLHGLMTHIRPP